VNIKLSHNFSYTTLLFVCQKQVMINENSYEMSAVVRFGALEEVFMSYRPHGAWRTMEVLEELA
jgi:hypothetical protein